MSLSGSEAAASTMRRTFYGTRRMTKSPFTWPVSPLGVLGGECVGVEVLQGGFQLGIGMLVYALLTEQTPLWEMERAGLRRIQLLLVSHVFVCVVSICVCPFRSVQVHSV